MPTRMSGTERPSPSASVRGPRSTSQAEAAKASTGVFTLMTAIHTMGNAARMHQNVRNAVTPRRSNGGCLRARDAMAHTFPRCSRQVRRKGGMRMMTMPTMVSMALAEARLMARFPESSGCSRS